jgi:gamma-glutamyltranspeptidase/glutathione hydrolase
MFLCVVDRHRNGVSLIQSNASDFGAHLAVGDTEVLLHNRGLGFSLRPGHPAEYGPGRRPPHTLSPALVTEPDGTLAGCVGTMGGDQQPQVLLQILIRMLRHGATPGAALAAPRWVLEVPGGTGFDTWSDVAAQRVVVEPEAPSSWSEGLGAAGHEVVTGEGTRFGHAQTIAVQADGSLAGAAEPRATTSLVAGD